MPDIYLVRTPQGLLPASEDDWALLNKIKLGTVLKYKLTRVRNYQHHRKFMALLTTVFDSQDTYTDLKNFYNALKLDCGWYSLNVTFDGEPIYVPDSMSFENMDQDTFSELYNDALRRLLLRIPQLCTGDAQRLIEHLARA